MSYGLFYSIIFFIFSGFITYLLVRKQVIKNGINTLADKTIEKKKPIPFDYRRLEEFTWQVNKLFGDSKEEFKKIKSKLVITNIVTHTWNERQHTLFKTWIERKSITECFHSVFFKMITKDNKQMGLRVNIPHYIDSQIDFYKEFINVINEKLLVEDTTDFNHIDIKLDVKHNIY